MEKQVVETLNAPSPLGPYSQAIRIGNFLFTSGQIPLDPKTGKMVIGEIEEQTEWVIRHIESILKADRLNLDNVIKTTVYLMDLSHFSGMNFVYEKKFSQTKPARSCIQVAALPKGAKLMIDAIAHL